MIVVKRKLKRFRDHQAPQDLEDLREREVREDLQASEVNKDLGGLLGMLDLGDRRNLEGSLALKDQLVREG
jgi:hypothetical protein